MSDKNNPINTQRLAKNRFYLPHILESSGIKEIYSALLGNGVGGAVNFVATLFVFLYVSSIVVINRFLFTHTLTDVRFYLD